MALTNVRSGKDSACLNAGQLLFGQPRSLQNSFTRPLHFQQAVRDFKPGFQFALSSPFLTLKKPPQSLAQLKKRVISETGKSQITKGEGSSSNLHPYR